MTLKKDIKYQVVKRKTKVLKNYEEMYHNIFIYLKVYDNAGPGVLNIDEIYISEMRKLFVLDFIVLCFNSYISLKKNII